MHACVRACVRVCVCVCLEGKRGDRQDTSDLNKVLHEFQSRLLLNSEKLDQPMKEEQTKRERLRDILDVV